MSGMAQGEVEQLEDRYVSTLVSIDYVVQCRSVAAFQELHNVGADTVAVSSEVIDGGEVLDSVVMRNHLLDAHGGTLAAHPGKLDVARYVREETSYGLRTPWQALSEDRVGQLTRRARERAENTAVLVRKPVYVRRQIHLRVQLQRGDELFRIVTLDDLDLVNNRDGGGHDAAALQVFERDRIGRQIMVLELNTVGR